MAAMVSVAKPASRAATARRRRAVRTSSESERVSSRVRAMTAPLGKDPGSNVQDTKVLEPSPRAGAALFIRRGNTIADALTLGTGTLAVDGVLCIAVDGPYPSNPQGQVL